MSHQETALRRLLAVDLPLERVGPQLRDAARRALRAGDEDRMQGVARVVVGELLRRGDLLRIAVEQDSVRTGLVGPLCLLRGTNRVVDLGALDGASESLELPDGLRALIGTEDKPRSPSPDELAGFDGMLGAMEDAQDLDIGDPRSGDKATILAGILRLLGKFTPQFRMYVQVEEADTVADDAVGVFRADPDNGPAWTAVRNPGQSVWIPAAAELPAAVVAELGADGEEFSAAVAVAVPLWEPEANAEHESGLFYLVAADDWGRDRLLRLADRLARFVSRRWQHQREVNQRIHTDSLTRVFNRAYFDSQFTLEIERARRSDEPLTLIICDLDHFKRVNDEYGHQAGDRVLQLVAQRLQEELRRIDRICRIGGEEFALILPSTGTTAGHDVVQRLLDAEFREDIVHEGQPVVLSPTFSYGAVTFPSGGSDAFELYRKADAMLYLSKDLGRNQCHFWNNEGEHDRILPGGAPT